MFKVDDRVRVIKFFGSTTSPHVGTTGTVIQVIEGRLLKGEPSDNEMYQYVVHVKLDRPQKVYGTWSKREVLTILYYPDEIEYEDNRQGWKPEDREVIAYNNDYVRLNNGLENCSDAVSSKNPLKNVFKLFANYRTGDTALHVRCLCCGDVIGATYNEITPNSADNYMYDNNQPSWPDVNTRLE